MRIHKCWLLKDEKLYHAISKKANVVLLVSDELSFNARISTKVKKAIPFYNVKMLILQERIRSSHNI